MQDGRWREFFAAFVPKAKRGSNGWWNGFCPFHEDPETSRSPSFGFNANSGGWRCQGCGEAGNALEFFAKIEGRPFDRTRPDDVRWARQEIETRHPGIMKSNRYGYPRGRTGPTASEIQAIAELERFRREGAG